MVGYFVVLGTSKYSNFTCVILFQFIVSTLTIDILKGKSWCIEFMVVGMSTLEKVIVLLEVEGRTKD